jgi:hypothetical protein
LIVWMASIYDFLVRSKMFDFSSADGKERALPLLLVHTAWAGVSGLATTSQRGM